MRLYDESTFHLTDEKLGDITLPPDADHIPMFFIVTECLDIPANGMEWPFVREDYISIWHILPSPANYNFD